MQDAFTYLLAQVARLHRTRVGGQLEELGVHVGQEMILMQLWMEDGQTQSDLAERTHVEPPTMTKMLRRMETAGLVERRRDENDARISRVYLTELGRTLHGPVADVWYSVDKTMLAGFTPEERLLLRRMLQKMRNSLS